MRYREVWRWAAVCITVAWLIFRGHDVVIVQDPEVRLEWDAVTTLGNGDPIPTGDSITYEVSLDDEPQGATEDLFFDFTLTDERAYVFAVRTVRTRPDGAIERSTDATLEATLVFAPSVPVNLILTRRP